MIYLLSQNLLSPAIYFFILGIIAGALKSDLNVPESMGRYLSIYLMMSIGFKGGTSISELNSVSYILIYTIFAAIFISAVIPFIGFFILKFSTTLDKPTAAALAAHYGSVSVVTFAAAVNFLEVNKIFYSGYMVSILAIMEVPAILSGLYIAHKCAPETNKHKKEENILAKEIFTNGAVLLMIGSFIAGIFTGKPGLDQLHGFLVAPFKGILCLFLMDMGLLVTKRFQNLKAISFNVIAFGIYMPIISIIFAILITKFVKMSNADSFLFLTLAASSSYIAVPAAMRLALPEAKTSIYMPISLGVTFPFNIIFGIPVYFYLSFV